MTAARSTLTLEALTEVVEALGLPVELSTEGGDEASCTFDGDMPSVSFSVIQ